MREIVARELECEWFNLLGVFHVGVGDDDSAVLFLNFKFGINCGQKINAAAHALFLSMPRMVDHYDSAIRKGFSNGIARPYKYRHVLASVLVSRKVSFQRINNNHRGRRHIAIPKRRADLRNDVFG